MALYVQCSFLRAILVVPPAGKEGKDERATPPSLLSSSPHLSIFRHKEIEEEEEDVSSSCLSLFLHASASKKKEEEEEDN